MPMANVKSLGIEVEHHGLMWVELWSDEKVEWLSSSAVNLQLISRRESLHTGVGCDEQEKLQAEWRNS